MEQILAVTQPATAFLKLKHYWRAKRHSVYSQVRNSNYSRIQIGNSSTATTNPFSGWKTPKPTKIQTKIEAESSRRVAESSNALPCSEDNGSYSPVNNVGAQTRSRNKMPWQLYSCTVHCLLQIVFIVKCFIVSLIVWQYRPTTTTTTKTMTKTFGREFYLD